VAFPAGIKAERACASGHFTVDERPRVPVKGANGEYWPEMQTLPTQHSVDLSTEGHGLTVLHTGMAEYEACDDENATLRRIGIPASCAYSTRQRRRVTGLFAVRRLRSVG